MIVESLGTVVATRKIAGAEPDGTITISIGMPVPFPGGADFYCPFRIQGLGDDRGIPWTHVWKLQWKLQ